MGVVFNLWYPSIALECRETKPMLSHFLSSDVQVTVAHMIYHFITVNTAYVSITIYIALPQYLFFWKPSAV